MKWLFDSLRRAGVHHYFPMIGSPPPRFVTESGAAVHGVLAEFETPGAVYHAAEKIRDAGYSCWDVYAPFPIHGIEDAMGSKRTILPVIVAAVAFTFAGLAWLMQWWMNLDYPLTVQGKPYAAWEPLVPIIFELGVLSSAFAALIGMMALNGLPRFHHPLLKVERFLRSSQDRFFICVEAADSKFDPARTAALLKDAGGHGVELVED